MESNDANDANDANDEELSASAVEEETNKDEGNSGDSIKDDELLGAVEDNDEGECSEHNNSDNSASDTGDSSSNDEESSTSEASSDENDDEQKPSAPVFDEDGRVLSKYEIMRLERIKRNQAVLAKLGLQGSSSGGGILSPYADNMKKKQRRKKQQAKNEDNKATQENRRLSSRAAKKNVDYSEKALLGDMAAGITAKPSNGAKKEKRKERARKDRMPIAIFHEFRRVERRNRQTLKSAEKAFRAAQIEQRHWNKQAGIFKRKELRRIQNEARIKLFRRAEEEAAEELRVLGTTSQNLLLQVDMRMQELRTARMNYDRADEVQHAQHRIEEASRNAILKMEIIDAMERFPVIVGEAEKTLDAMLLKRIPNIKETKPRKRKLVATMEKHKIEEKSNKKSMNDTNRDNGLGSAQGSTPHMTIETNAEAQLAISTEVNHSKQNTQKGNAELIEPAMKGDSHDTIVFGPTESMTIPPLSIGIESSMATTPLESGEVLPILPKPGSAIENSIPEKPIEPKKHKDVHVRNVGGPVFPEFSKVIKRSWLSADTPTLPNVSDHFVFQVGDLVLYFPAGHCDFLKVHPDPRAKGRLKLRQPLWERANSAKKKKPAGIVSTDDKELNGSSQSKPDADTETTLKKKRKSPKESAPWWDERWLASIVTGMGRYPILCRVEKAVAEFPEDPNGEGKPFQITNVVEGEKPKKKGKKELNKSSTKTKKKSRPQMGLALTLKPLTPCVPPVEQIGQALSLPPTFTVLTFPSNDPPFIIPFTWAYERAHAWDTNDTVKLKFQDSKWYTGRIKAFLPIPEYSASNRFDQHENALHKLFHGLKKTNSSSTQILSSCIFKKANSSSSLIPSDDLKCVLNTLLEYYTKADEYRTTSGKGWPTTEKILNTTFDSLFLDVMQSTLPIWDGVKVCWDDNTETNVSPWEVSIVTSKLAQPKSSIVDISAFLKNSRGGSVGIMYSLDESLRKKLVGLLENFLDTRGDADIFVSTVKESEAPAYYCFVPIGMCFQRILRRLKRHSLEEDDEKKTSGHSVTSNQLAHTSKMVCYYRHVSAVISDLADIAQNCALYNMPDSPLVLSARAIYNELKKQMLSVETRHIKEQETMEQQQLSRHKSKLVQEDLTTKTSSRGVQHPGVLPRTADRCAGAFATMDNPFESRLWRGWMEREMPDSLWSMVNLTQGVSSEGTSAGNALPKDREITSNHGLKVNEGVTDPRVLYLGKDAKYPEYDAIKNFEVPRWFPQSGDRILYSHALHSQFVKGHMACLTTQQCSLPQIPMPHNITPTPMSAGTTAHTESTWLVGTLVTVSAVFPESPKSRDEYPIDFLTPILALRIKFDYLWNGSQIHTIFWRPCSFARAKEAHTPPSQTMHKAATCCVCNLSQSRSWIRPAWTESRVFLGLTSHEEEPQLRHVHVLPPSNPNVSPYNIPCGLPVQYIETISKCFDFLRERCIDGVPPDFLDSIACMARLKSAADNCFSNGYRSSFITGAGDNIVEARTTSILNTTASFPQGIEGLFWRHYLAPWSLSTIDEHLSGEVLPTRSACHPKKISQHESTLPHPELTLDLIHRRLMKGWYRHIDALLNDIREAYVSSVLYLLTCPMEDNESIGIASMRKIAEVLAHRESTPEDRAQLLSSRKPAAPFTHQAKSKVSNGSVNMFMNENRVSSKKPQEIPKSRIKTGTKLQGSSKVRSKPKSSGPSKQPSRQRKRAPKKIKLNETETHLLTRIVAVRKLYATALVCACDTKVAETALNLKNDDAHKEIESKTNISPVEQQRQLARGRIEWLIESLARDKYMGRKPLQLKLPYPTVKVRVKLRQGVLNGSELRISSIPVRGTTEQIDSFQQRTPQTETENTRTNSEQKADTEKIDQTPNKHHESLHLKETTVSNMTSTTHSELDQATTDASKADEQLEAITVRGGDPHIDVSDRTFEHVLDYSKPLLLESQDYEANVSLVSTLFGRVGRKEACMRCKVNQRSMLYCRINRAHSNPDFNWIKCLGDMGGLDGLLHQLRYPLTPFQSMATQVPNQTNVNFIATGSHATVAPSMQSLIQTSGTNSKTTTVGETGETKMQEDVSTAGAPTGVGDRNGEDKMSSKISSPSESAGCDLNAKELDAEITDSSKISASLVLGTAPKTNKKEGAGAISHLTENEKDQSQSIVNVDPNEPSPDELLKKANVAVTMATKALKLAKIKAESRPLLSEQFIQETFPYDSTDGHFELCVICGLSGDVLCCETCENVMHAKCAGLSTIPEGDWFCKKCSTKAAPVVHSPSHANEPNADQATSIVMKDIPKEVIEIDSNTIVTAEKDDDLDSELKLSEKEPTLDSLLEELKSFRLKGKETQQNPSQKADIQANAPIKSEIVVHDECKKDNSQADGSVQQNSVHSDSDSDQESANEPDADFFPMEVGTQIVKHFPSHGDFKGVVTCLPTEKNPFYRVHYDDGDDEDMSENEIQNHIPVMERKQIRTKHKSNRQEARKAKKDNVPTKKKGRGRPKGSTNKKRGRPAATDSNKKARKTFQPDIEISSEPAKKMKDKHSLSSGRSTGGGRSRRSREAPDRFSSY